MRDGISGKLSAINRLQGHAANLAGRMSDRWRKAFKGLRDEADRTYAAIKSRLGGIADYIKVGIAGAITAVVTGAVRLAAELEQTRVSYETLLKSQEGAAAIMKEINAFADVTPFNNAELLRAGKNLLALGIPADQLMGKIRRLGDISAGSGKDINELALIYGKMASAGIIQNEDLNQLIDAGIPIMGELQRMLGLSTLEIKKLAEKGLDIGLIDQAFQNLTDSGGLYFEMMAKQSQTTAGLWSTLVAKFQNTLAQLGQAFEPFTQALIRTGIQIMENLIPGLQRVGSFLSFISPVLAAIVAYWAAYNAVTLAYIAYTKLAQAGTFLWMLAQGKLNIALMANPIGLVIGLIAGMVAAIAAAYVRFDAFRGLLHGVWAAFKQYFGNIGRLAAAVGDILVGAVTLDKDRVAKGFANLKNTLATANASVAARFMQGYEEGVSKQMKMPSWMQTATGSMDAVSGSNIPGGSAAPDLTEGVLSPAPASPSNSVQTGAVSGPRSINVTIERFQDQVIFNTTNLETSEAEVQAWFEDMLLRVANSINQIAPA